MAYQFETVKLDKGMYSEGIHERKIGRAHV